MDDKQSKNLGQQIGDTVRSAFSSGDLSQLKNIGPAVQDALKDIPGVTINVQGQNDKQPPAKRPQQQPGPAYTPQPPNRPAWQGSAAPARKGRVSATHGLPSVILGGIGTFTFGLSTLGLGITALVGTAAGAAVGAGVLFVPFALCLGLLVSGVGNRRLAARVRQYYTVLEQKNVRTLEEMTVATGQTPEQIKKDIRKVQRKGIAPDLRMDAQETCVMLGDEAYSQYMDTERTRKQREAEKLERAKRMGDPTTAALETFKDEGRVTIRKIREVNEALPGEDISRKLDKLEATCGKIFAYVEKHPNKLPDTRKFMDYYLPTTLKLLEKYRQYEEMDVQLPNIIEAKKEIEHTLGTIDDAFTNLLESLYRDDTLDVSTDIEVLKTMLQQEGLTGNKFQIDADDADTPSLTL